MPTYYNGKEITSTSKLSGLSLIGRDSVNIGGKVTTLSTPPPPPPREMRVYGDPGSGGTAGFAHPGFACSVGPSGYEIIAFISIRKNIQLFTDKNFEYPLADGFYWTDDTSQIGGDFGSFFILIQGGNGAIFGTPNDCS
jgi:hypothetical protein